MFYSPLRYPGGKNKLAAFLAKICIDNNINRHYVEPYCGGSSVALFLLFEGYVEHITINDKDPSIFSFWHSVLNETEALCSLINETEVTLENWEMQRRIQTSEDSTPLELGFSTLFLNRTNRSGIIKGGMIGGREQESEYAIDCRFNKAAIIDRIRAISAKRAHITLRNLDALNLIDVIIQEQNNASTILYFDPPYYLKAEKLYMNFYKHDDHADVAYKIAAIQGINWIVSYDNHDSIKKLYDAFPSKEYTFNHSAHTSKLGKEILFFSQGIIRPEDGEWNPVDFKLVRNKRSKKIVLKPKRIKTEKVPIVAE